MNFLDFGRQHRDCYVMEDGFVFWEIDRKQEDGELLLENGEADILAHVIILEGEMKVEWGGRPYLLTKSTFANFIDSHSIKICEMSKDVKAYLMLFTSRFITSLLKNTPPFPPSYILKIKSFPVTLMQPDTLQLFIGRLELLKEIFTDKAHSFQTGMLKCVLWMFVMDMSNEYLKQDEVNVMPGGKKEYFS